MPLLLQVLQPIDAPKPRLGAMRTFGDEVWIHDGERFVLPLPGFDGGDLWEEEDAEAA